MKNLNRVIEKLVEDYGFSYQSWKNYDKETIQDVAQQIKEGMLYRSYVDIYPNVEPQIKPKEFVLLEKIINFYENFEFGSFEDYIDYINKISNLTDKINNLQYVLIENINSDFHYLAFIFPTS